MSDIGAKATLPQEPLRALPEGVSSWRTRLRLRRQSADPRPFAMLRRRLIITNLMATTVVLLIVSVAVYFFEANLELAQIDKQLASEAIGQISGGLPTPGPNTVDPSETPYNPDSANYFSVVVGRPGQVVQDDDKVQRLGLPDWYSVGPVLTGAQSSTISTVTHGETTFRLYTAPIKEGARIVGAVQSGMSLGSYYQQLHDLTRGLIALDLLIVLLMLVSSVSLTERALKPACTAFERQRQFAAGASHELRTPLSLIRSLAELVADHRCAPVAAATPLQAGPGAPSAAAVASASLENQDNVADDAKEIIHEVDYMTRLVTDLLLLARDEHDRRALNWVTVDLRRVLQGVVGKIEPLAAARGITLTSDLESKAEGQMAAMMEGDPDRLRELALILIENAVRYTPRGGHVNVSLKTTRGAMIRGERHGHAMLTVRDNGIGIAPEDQSHVFEPFYRATSSTLRRANAAEVEAAADANGFSSASGSGLGLALAHWIVEAHKGQISLHSALGQGTTFVVELPLVARSHPPHLSGPRPRPTPSLSGSS